METQKILTKEKLEFFGIIKKVLSLSTRNWKFIILSFLTSFPLFSSLVLFQLMLTQDVIEIVNIFITDPETHYHFYYNQSFFIIRQLFANAYQKFIFFGPLYLVTIHLLTLFNTIAIVHSSSEIYAGSDHQITLNQMLTHPFTKVGFKRPLITSIYSLLLTSLIVIGLLSLATNIYATKYFFICTFFFGALFKVLVTKFIEWSAIWKTGVVISILQEQHGYIPIGVAGCITRGCRRRGFLLMFVFFMWRLVVRSGFFYLWWQNQGDGLVLIVISIVTAFSLCLENVLKGVAFMVYFYDCKKRFMEKKIDLENGREAASEQH